MNVNFQTIVSNRGITRTAQSLQTPNDNLGRILLTPPSSKVNVNKILRDKDLMSKAVELVKKHIY